MRIEISSIILTTASLQVPLIFQLLTLVRILLNRLISLLELHSKKLLLLLQPLLRSIIPLWPNSILVSLIQSCLQILTYLISNPISFSFKLLTQHLLNIYMMILWNSRSSMNNTKEVRPNMSVKIFNQAIRTLLSRLLII